MQNLSHVTKVVGKFPGKLTGDMKNVSNVYDPRLLTPGLMFQKTYILENVKLIEFNCKHEGPDKYDLSQISLQKLLLKPTYILSSDLFS